MSRLVILALSLLPLLVITDDADAIGRRRRGRSRSYGYSTYNYTNTYASFSGGPQAVAEQKAAHQAASNAMFHPGGSFGGGFAEGVGAGATPAQALGNCCYTGQRVVLGQSVCQGSNGLWYACKIYQ